ncbi:MAG: lipoate--protein ligase [Bacteroidales bacterium]|nr:lipoate--protein ligase [Bacteroidales bacterium]
MRCIRSHTTDPYFNLAAEEYLLRNSADEYYFQYVNDASVIIGKHQNALAEIDLRYIEEQDILLARRISGGGAVYHDQGNMNYSFVTNEKAGDYIRFGYYTAAVITLLNNLGVKAVLGSRNEIITAEGKISGTASHVFKSRVLHHGTLLFNADLDRLAKCLYTDAMQFRDKAVRSVRSKVVNISALLKEKMDAPDFYDHVFNTMLRSDPGNTVYIFSEADRRGIGQLREQKFTGWDWNYGYSPKYVVEKEVDGIQFRTTVVKGIMEIVEISGMVGDGVDPAVPSHLLTGRRHDKRMTERVLKETFSEDLSSIILEGLF